MRLPFTRHADEDLSDTGEEPQPKKKESLVHFLITLAILAWLIRSFLVAPFSIPSGSTRGVLWSKPVIKEVETDSNR